MSRTMVLGTWALGALLAAAPCAQETKNEARELARAMAIEEAEHDLAKAIEVYRRLAEVGLDAEVRTVAQLRLGLALRQVGRWDEAVAALREAARGEGPHAQRAKALAAEQDPQGKRALEAKILGGIGRLRKEDSARDDLVWIGEPVVPQLLTVVEAEKVDAAFMARASYVLLRVGGARVVEWLSRVVRSKDSLAQAAVISSCSSATARDRRIVEELRLLLRANDPTIRARGVVALWPYVPARDVIECAGDESSAVRFQTLAILNQRWMNLRHEESKAQSLAQLLPHLEAGLKDLDSKVGKEVLRFLHTSTVWESSPGRRLFLKALAFPAYERLNIPQARGAVLGATEHLDEIVAFARQLGPIEYSREGQNLMNERQRALISFIEVCRARWQKQALGGVLELVSLGYGRVAALRDSVMTWAETPEQIVQVLRRLGGFVYCDIIAKWAVERGIPEAAFPHLQGFLRAYGRNELRHVRRSSPRWVAIAVGSLSLPQGVSLLVDLAQDPRFYRAAAAGLVLHSSPAAVDAMRRAMVLDIDHEDAGIARNYLFRRLLEMGAGDAPEEFARAYQLGLTARSEYQKAPGDWTSIGVSMRGLGWLYLREHCEKFDGAALAAIVDRCLALGLEQPWADIMGPGGHQMRHLPAEVFRVLFDRALDCPRVIDSSSAPRRRFLAFLARKADQPGHSAFLLRCFESESDVVPVLAAIRKSVGADPKLEGAIRALLTSGDEAVVLGAILALQRVGDGQSADAILPLLEHESYNIRIGALRAFADLAPDRAGTAIAPLMKHTDASTRVVVCELAAKVLSRDLVPAMLQGLRDPDASVRKSAQGALQAISFYEEQTGRWKRILNASGLEGATAAEALIRKARDGKRGIRLAAIASLGTLGVPETLPFLLALMEDPDLQIAAAAKAALQKINAAPRTTSKK